MQFTKVSGRNNSHKVTIYTLSTCVWCKMTKQFLSDSGIEYDFVDVDLLGPEDKRKAHEVILTRGGSLSYPTTIVDDKTIINGFRKDLLKEAIGV